MPRLERYHLVVLSILAMGLFLRFFGQNWDQGLYLHPDERFIAIVSYERVGLSDVDDLGALFDPATSPINPRRDGADGKPLSFAYGSLPMYVQNVVGSLVSQFSATNFNDYQSIYRVGRPLTALMDTLTLALVILLARRLFGRPAAVVAGALYAFAVLPIQLSHFFTVDVWLTCFVTAALYLSIRYLDAPSLGRALALGAVVGCAFATKASVPSLLAPLALAYLVPAWRARDRVPALGNAAAAGVVALATFTLFEPYAIVRMQPFIEDIRTQARIVRGQWDVPFTRQFVGLTPGIYELRNMFAYSLGPGLLLAGLAGIGAGLRQAWRARDVATAVPLAFVLAYVPTLLITEARFLRYALPLVPVAAVYGAGLLARAQLPARSRAWQAAAALVLIVTAVWGIGFTSIYARENPRIAASKWMEANIPRGSAVTVEAWDDALPLPYPGSQSLMFEQVPFDVYGDEPPEAKATAIAQTLIRADYVVLSSDRIRLSVDNLPWRYAVQNEYYRRLMAGQLGFQLVYDADLRPELFGYRFDDTNADESFTVYDHPHVRIYKKVENLTVEQIRERLMWGISQPWEPTRYPSRTPLMLDEPVSAIESTSDAGWNGVAEEHTPLAIASWLLALELFGLAVLPLSALVFRRTPDRGVLSAKLLGLLLVGWVGWFAASLRWWGARSLHIAVVLALVAAACWGLYWRRTRQGRGWRLASWRAYLGWSSAWLGLFAFFLLLRGLYPDFWQIYFGGEKPFELAYLRAISRSVWYPPYDPWYADGTINYYYYGWHLVATIIKLTGVGVSLGFQLGSATFAALLGCQALSTGGLLISRGRRRLPARQVVLGGALVVGALAFIGNLDALMQVTDIGAPDSPSFDFWRSTRVIDGTINEFPYFSELWADLHPHVINLPIYMLLLTLLAHLTLDSRPGRRALRDWLSTLALPAGVIALTLGSLAVTNSWDAPLAAGLTVLAFGYAGLLRSWRWAAAGMAVGLATAVAAFALFVPFYSGFYSVVRGVNRASDGSKLGQYLTVWGIFYSLVALALGVGAWQRVMARGDLRDARLFGVIAFVVGGLAQVAWVVASRHGVAAAGVVAWLVVAVFVTAGAAVARPSRFRPLVLEPLAVAVVVASVLAPHRPAAALALGVAVAALLRVVADYRRPSDALPWGLVAIAGVTTAATEIMYVADDLQHSPWERMNTVFKFYLQAWLLLAVGATLLVIRLVASARWQSSWPSRTLGVVAGPVAGVQNTERSTRVRRVRPPMAVGVAGLLVLATGLVYPIAGTPVRLDQRMPSSPTSLTLDGYAWMRGGQIPNGTGQTMQFGGDLAAIEWLNENVSGTPVILEGSIGPYRGNGSRISSGTGLPTVLGWARHQEQQRYLDGIGVRVAEVRAIYNELDPVVKLEMLRRYNVRYVIVGDVERLWNTPENPETYASAAGLQAFDALLGQGLTLVFESGTTRIYCVDDFPRLAPAPDAVRHL